MSKSFEIYAEQVNVNVEEGTVIVTGVDLDDLLGQFDTQDILNSLDYSDVMDYVTEVEKDKRESDE